LCLVKSLPADAVEAFFHKSEKNCGGATTVRQTILPGAAVLKRKHPTALPDKIILHAKVFYAPPVLAAP
jgi:hypothetical protein